MGWFSPPTLSAFTLKSCHKLRIDVQCLLPPPSSPARPVPRDRLALADLTYSCPASLVPNCVLSPGKSPGQTSCRPPLQGEVRVA